MEEDKVKQKLVSAIGTDILNQLSLNGLIEAAKFYSIKLAEEHYNKMTHEEREQMLQNIDARDAPPAQEEPPKKKRGRPKKVVTA